MPAIQTLHVRQKSTFRTLNVVNFLQSILTQKHEPFPVFYLQDRGSPVIGIYPWCYQVQHGNNLQHWVRNASGNLEKVPQSAAVPVIESAGPVQGFAGGWLALLGYDTLAYQQGIDTAIRDCGAIRKGYFDVFLRQCGEQWLLYASEQAEQAGLVTAIMQAVDASAQQPVGAPDPLLLQPRWSLAQYQAAFEQVQAYLYAGDGYQVNLTQCWQAAISPSCRLLPWLGRLQAHTSAPFAGYFTDQAVEILSMSPELFVVVTPDRQIMTRPIKGTRPRRADRQADQAEYAALQTSEKDRAENLMIDDLLRNDLGRLAETGSVQVDQLFVVESFQAVHHLVSQISARLRPDQDVLDSIMTIAPGGSITGAPKIRAMQIIAELEAGPRGAYCGALGYVSANGHSRFNILIRTLQRAGQQVELWAGGGITVASGLQAEYQECLDKVGGMLALLADPASVT